MRILVNEASRIERAQHLQDMPYERSAPGFDSSATSAAPTPNEINDLTHKKSNYVVARFGFVSYFYLVIRVIQ